ncbi:hypothetical protein COB72_07455 [bacterium]|nr:MAG: hypothetical protein COB72_07455 [bacterium]
MLQLTNRRLTLAAIALSFFGALPASAQIINEDIKITASDAADDDWFGRPIAISGATAIVGAFRDDDTGSDSGSAYVFNTTTGQQLFKLTASDAEQFDNFGHSVAVSGALAIIGSPHDNDAGLVSGSAYLFDTTTGKQLFKLTASDAAQGDEFGFSVGISGTTVIIGARGDSDMGQLAGSAYLFDTETGLQIAKLTASDAAQLDEFGWSVAISGATAIVGARHDNDAGFRSGSAYLFNTVTGDQIAKLTASDAAENNWFGYSVAITGSTAIVGAPAEGSFSGSAYLFDTTSNQQIFKLTASDAAVSDQLGTCVAISGSTAIVGAQHDDDAGSASGSAYLFDTTTGQQSVKLIASDASQGDQFGRSVAISGTNAIVGAWLDDDAGADSGSVYVFGTPTPCLADLTGDGTLDFFDVSLFLTYLETSNPIADFNGDGLINFFDVSTFLIEFTAGCP